MSDQETGTVKEEPTPTPLADFLEGTPPGSVTSVTKLAEPQHLGLPTASYIFTAPDIQLHCGSDSCNGTMFFRHTSNTTKLPAAWHFFYVTYRCSNCQETEKTFSLAALRAGQTTSGDCYKFGENPEYGPPTAAGLIKLIGPDRDTFLKGRRCENQGLGIGAFVYYRRVVENQKNRILGKSSRWLRNSARVRKPFRNLRQRRPKLSSVRH